MAENSLVIYTVYRDSLWAQQWLLRLLEEAMLILLKHIWMRQICSYLRVLYTVICISFADIQSAYLHIHRYVHLRS